LSAGILLLAITVPSQARDVYGNVGYHEYPWSILVGYNDHGGSYDRGHRHGHRHKHKHHRHYRHHHHHKKHYTRHHAYKYRDRYRRVYRCDY